MNDGPKRNMLAYLTVVCGLFTFTLHAEAELEKRAAVSVTYVTEPEKHYQLQVRTGAEWNNVGFAVMGTGRPIDGLYPAGDYRVITPTNQWVLVF